MTKMMAKKLYISMRLHKEPKTIPPITFIMPEGCMGILFAFKDKKSAYAFDGKVVNYVEAEIEDKDNG